MARTLDVSQITRIKAALMAGATVKDIAARFGFSVMGFRRQMRRHNLIPKNSARIRWSPKRTKRSGKQYCGDAWRNWSIHA
jgi:hypothetical protein